MATPPDFAVGQVLTAQMMDSVAMWLVKEQTIGSAVPSVEVTDAFSSDYDAYKIVIGGTGTGSTPANLSLKLGATTTGYYAGYNIVNYSTSTPTTASDHNAASWTRAGHASTIGIAFNIDLINPFVAQRTQISSDYPILDTAAGSVTFAGILGGTTSYTAFTITPASGTLTGGTVRVYGYRN